MKLILFPALILLASLQSCFVVDGMLEEGKPNPVLPLDIVVKDSIYHYIQTQKDDTQKYLSFGYKPMKIIVPQTIKDLEKWKSRKGQAEFDQGLVDKKIKYFDTIVESKKLSRKISTEHLFSLREKGDTLAELQLVNFILSNEINVVDYQPIYRVELTTEEEKIFAKFYYQRPIIKAYSYEESQKLSKEFYNYFKTEWESKENSLDKSLFLKHIINVVTIVDRVNEVDVQSITENTLFKYMEDKRPDINMYNVIDFSPLYQISETKEDEGFYFFHTFNFENEGRTDEMTIYVKFNSFYEVERIVETNQSYDVLEKYRN
ncbi:MAG: hypothetical protein AB8B74_05700 [Crocinitomicaceae bacterium]